MAPNRALARNDGAVGQHRVEVLADGGGAEPQLGAELGRGGRAMRQQQPGDAVTGPPVDRDRLLRERRRVFHNAHVTYFGEHPQTQAKVIQPTA
jgi:hypothetical protein